MSLSRPSDRLQNPAEKFIDFRNGKFGYFDKESKKRIDIELGKCIVLDCSTFCITGYIDTPNLKTGVFSNAARYPKKDKIVVKSREKGVLTQGTYEEIKDYIERYKIRYTRNAYIWREGELCLLQLSGDAFGSWMEGVESKDRNEKKRGSMYVVVTGEEERQKGKTKYIHLTFGFEGSIDKDELQEAIKADEIVQSYLDDYFKESADKVADRSDNGSQGESKWHEAIDPYSGMPISNLTASQAIELDTGLRDNGEAASELGVAVEQMIQNIEWGTENWKTFKTSKGKELSSASYDELNNMLTWAMNNQPHSRFRFAVEAAVADHKGREVPPYDGGEEDDSDEIPF